MADDEAQSRGTLLVVDDEVELLELVRRRLTEEGYRVLTAQQGADALVLARQAHPDVILLDVVMPQMSGREVLARLRAAQETSDIPVIMISALGEEHEMAASVGQGAVVHLSKPFNVKELVREIRLASRKHQDRHRGRPQPAAEG